MSKKGDSLDYEWALRFRELEERRNRLSLKLGDVNK